MSMVITIFPATLRWGVIPVLSPTVPNAENTSKMIPSKSHVSMLSSITEDTNIAVKEQMRMANVLRITNFGMVRPKNAVSSLPLRKQYVVVTNKTRAVVFIPPAVPPGEPPINIRNINRRRVGEVRLPMSTV